MDVAGKVRRPGVDHPARGVAGGRRAEGGRAGREAARPERLNLARVLVDGEQILVGRPGPPGGSPPAPRAGAPAAVGGHGQPQHRHRRAARARCPGSGPVTAQKILDWRAAHGAFSSVDELLEVDGIGEKTLADLAPLVTV